VWVLWDSRKFNHKPLPLIKVFNLLESYFYVIDQFYDKTHFTYIWVYLSGFKNIMMYFEEVFQVIVLKT